MKHLTVLALLLMLGSQLLAQDTTATVPPSIAQSGGIVCRTCTYTYNGETYTGAKIIKKMQASKGLLGTGCVLTAGGLAAFAGAGVYFIASIGNDSFNNGAVITTMLVSSGSMLLGVPLVVTGGLIYKKWGEVKEEAILVAGITNGGNIGLTLKF